MFEAKTAGDEALVKSCEGDTRDAASLLVIEELVGPQVEAIKT